MPLTVIVKRSGDEKESELELTFDGSRVVIGRGSSCDIRLPDPSVSQRHALIRADGSSYQLLDEGSPNGTFVGGVRLSPRAPRALRSGDLIRVGRVWIEIRIDQSLPTADIAMATRDLALALVARGLGAIGADVTPKVVIVEGPDICASLLLSEEGRVYLVGRGEKCDLLLADADASREHAQLVRRGTTVLIRDLGSKNPVLLGEQGLTKGRDVPWKSSVVARVGASVLALEEPVAIALAELEAAPEEPVPAADIPPAPMSQKEMAAPPAPPPSARGAEAPIANVSAAMAGSTTVPVRKKTTRVSQTDVFIAVAAIVVLALSIAGLFWVLKS
ncbi:hypothetical protein BH09MYX1_BH09MYX1_04900 [soil metagenome]